MLFLQQLQINQRLGYEHQVIFIAPRKPFYASKTDLLTFEIQGQNSSKEIRYKYQIYL